MLTPPNPYLHPMPTFDITLPVLNEAPTLVRQVRHLHGFMRDTFPQQERWRIVIADNGSTDDTRKLAEGLANELPEVELVRVPKRGVGLALKTSWGQSQANIVGYMDLDFATDLCHLPEALRLLVETPAEFVYATRLHPDSKVIGRPFKREVSSRGFNFLLKSYLNVGYSDGMCGFKFLERRILADLMAGGAQNDGWFFSTELLTVAEWQGVKLHELPVTWTDDVSSSRVEILPLAQRYIRSMRALKPKRGLAINQGRV